jgi:hypothetical protein
VFLEVERVLEGVVEVVVIVVELGVQVMVLVQKRVEWGLEVQLGKNDGLEALCCSPSVTWGRAFVGWILVLKQTME